MADYEFPLDEPYPICNCGKKGCPVLQKTENGIEIAVPRVELRETSSSSTLLLDSEQATLLRQRLQDLGF